MSAIPVIAIFDVGKTNKKLFLFDENYHIVYEKSARFIETVDEDGDPCENLESLELSVFESLREVFKLKEFEIKAINFSTYGASFVHINAAGKPVAPLYNYLKEFPEDLKEKFYKTYGGETKLALETCSPILGNLNSGMQLYRIKYKKLQLFNQIKYSLHLPQYLSYLLSNMPCTDITSIGCHTGLWNFEKNDYHAWVYAEGLTEKFAPIIPSNGTFSANKLGTGVPVGVGLHDSSAALIPYLVNFSEPFILISTGTWCISLNPFNHSPITDEELANDCLCYMQYKGSPVKASRLFAGNEHELQIKRIASHFDVNTSLLKNVGYDPAIIQRLTDGGDNRIQGSRHQSAFAARDLSVFESHQEAYHQLIVDIMEQQYQSTKLALKGTKVRRIFVDGGFSKNSIYMNLLAKAFPEMEVFAASMAQATAVGAAIAIHRSWNSKTLPADIIELKYYSAPQHTTI
ncbi:FGGY-family carbohydrate kinase [Mucilaginibacter sp. E4BP6]|uniref:FGGY-family carbohydrate kinase n=1 Tax=Mucilaginibacter sp. E4BP6 TaxID=2723089 RepID=UPI0015C7EBE4|nr:FGGY family carbohydrate kinase [Mucilaginibacter sp. E4BP6]NYE65795.1 sugar (pentulose or hexulose) kinase [Mucilaginibacter sp. E4BP6]